MLARGSNFWFSLANDRRVESVLYDKFFSESGYVSGRFQSAVSHCSFLNSVMIVLTI